MPFRKGHKGFRRNYGFSKGSTTPRPGNDGQDQEMLDAPEDSQISQDVDAEGEPDDAAGDDNGEGEEAVDEIDGGEDDEDEAALEEVDSNATPGPEDDSPRKRRARSARSRPPADFDNTLPPGEEGYRGPGTPRRAVTQKRNKGAFRSRPKARGTAAAIQFEKTRQVVDKEGNTARIVNDEVVLPEDAEGETKVDNLGNLSGGREYRVRTFKMLGRGDRLYMLSTEPARCMGFRDSYLFFNRHLQLYKVLVDDESKSDMINREIIPHSYKGRAIGVVTARSVYREFGARIIISGKKIVDDYEVAEARARGDMEGELAVPLDEPPKEGKNYNKNQYVAWHGASNVYHNGAPTMPAHMYTHPRVAKGKVTMGNWMFEHAKAASSYNSRLVGQRRKTLQGVYEPHTNVMAYPRIMQPTHARWEAVVTEGRGRKRKLMEIEDAPNGTTVAAVQAGPQAHAEEVNSTSIVDTTAASADPTPSLDAMIPPKAKPTLLPPPSALLTRNYLIVDTHLQTAPHASLSQPGPELPETTPLCPGSGRLPELNEEMMAMLPAECREALVRAKRDEEEWTGRWRGGDTDGGSGPLRIGVGVLGI